MLVLMQHSGGVQIAYRSPIHDICGVCKDTIVPGQYLTRHQAPDPHHRDPRTGKYRMVPYIACSSCAPFIELDHSAGDLALQEIPAHYQSQGAGAELPASAVRSSPPRVLARIFAEPAPIPL